MIRLATALGIIVVEAGGNGGEDLDLVTNPGGDNFFDPSDPWFRDSGAIIVGAASAAAPHTRLGFSSHGARVDCYGWGNGVHTCGDGWTGTSTTAYTGSFSGTSSASPIIAGAALAVQGLVEIRAGLRLSPAQMRAVLTDPATSTPSDDPPVDRIGSCRTCGRSSRTGSSTCVPMSISATSWAIPETRMPARFRPVRT